MTQIATELQTILWKHFELVFDTLRSAHIVDTSRTNAICELKQYHLCNVNGMNWNVCLLNFN